MTASIVRRKVQWRQRVSACAVTAVMIAGVQLAAPSAQAEGELGGDSGASSETMDSGEVKEALVGADVDTSSPVSTKADADSAVVATTTDAAVDVPRDSAAPVTVATDEATIGFNLPAATSGTSQKVGEDAAAFSASDGTAQVVNVTGTPDLPLLQFLTTIPGPDAPSVYRYPVDLPPGSVLRVAEDGGLEILDESGAVLTSSPAPWLKDANGVELPGAAVFRVEGSTVVLELDLSGVTAWPATSDPLWFVAAAAAVRGVAWWALRACGAGAVVDAVIWGVVFGSRRIRDIAGQAVQGCVSGIVGGAVFRRALKL